MVATRTITIKDGITTILNKTREATAAIKKITKTKEDIIRMVVMEDSNIIEPINLMESIKSHTMEMQTTTSSNISLLVG